MEAVAFMPSTFARPTRFVPKHRLAGEFVQQPVGNLFGQTHHVREILRRAVVGIGHLAGRDDAGKGQGQGDARSAA